MLSGREKRLFLRIRGRYEWIWFWRDTGIARKGNRPLEGIWQRGFGKKNGLVTSNQPVYCVSLIRLLFDEFCLIVAIFCTH